MPRKTMTMRLFPLLVTGFFAVSFVGCVAADERPTVTKAQDLSPNPSVRSACSFGAFVNETDRAGLNVRQSPSVTSKPLGKLPANYVHADGGMIVRVEVEVLASQNGWFLIDSATDNTTLTEKPARKMYAGKGWVSGKKLVVKTQATKARLSPEANAGTAFLVGDVLDGDSLSKPAQLVACKDKWVQLEYALDKLSKEELAEIKIDPSARIGTPAGRVRGWVNKICAIQETSCSGLGNEP